MAIAERMPDVGRRFYDNVIAHTIGSLAAYLDARVAVGELRSRTANWRHRNS